MNSPQPSWRSNLSLWALVLVLVMGLSATTGAQNRGAEIAVVDLDKAINATEQGKAAREELARKKRGAEEELQPMVQRFQTLQKEIDDKKFVWNEDKLRAKQLDLAELQNKIQNTLKELEGQLKVDYERLVGPLRTKISSIVEEIGKDQSFIVVLERNTPGLLYTRETLDITDVVIQRFNKQG